MSNKNHFRISSRSQLSCQVNVQRTDFPNSPQIVSYTKDIGTGGLFLENDNGFKKDEHVKVIMSIPSTWEPLVLNALVTWIKPAINDDPAGAGLQFSSISPNDMLILNDLLHSLEYDS